MKIEKTNVMRTLDQKKIKYNTYTYVADEAIDGNSVALKIGKDPKLVYKTLVTKSVRNYYVFMICVTDSLDLKKAAKSVDEKALELIPVNQINDLTGYVRGGCSPIGMKKSFITVIDKKCLENELMIFSAGKVGYQVELVPNELIKLISAKVDNISIIE